MGRVTNVDSYSLRAHNVAGVRDTSKIVCYHQVLFAAVTKLQQFEEKTTNIFAASGFQKIANIHACSTAHLRIRYWERWPSGLGGRPATGRSMVRVPIR